MRSESSKREESDAILSRKGPITRVMSKRLQKDWARVTEEGPRGSHEPQGRFQSPWAKVESTFLCKY